MIGNNRKNYTEVNNLIFLTEGGKNPKQCHRIKHMTNDSRNLQHSHAFCWRSQSISGKTNIKGNNL